MKKNNIINIVILWSFITLYHLPFLPINIYIDSIRRINLPILSLSLTIYYYIFSLYTLNLVTNNRPNPITNIDPNVKNNVVPIPPVSGNLDPV